MEFNPNNHIIQLLVKGIGAEEKGRTKEASVLFHQAWNEASNDLEKYLAAYYVARGQKNVAKKLQWMHTSLEYALKIDDPGVKSALPSIYACLARSYEELGDTIQSKKSYGFAASCTGKPSDQGPFYHGTKADLSIGDLLTPGKRSNYEDDLVMNHIYFTALRSGAGLAAALAKGEGRERVYVVEPTGEFENDPNVTDKKFPGNPTRSYRTLLPLKIIGEVTDWQKQTAAQLSEWREKLANQKGDIIN